MLNTTDKDNLRFDSKGVHAKHTNIPLRELVRFAALHYSPERSRYFDVFVRDVFVARLALKIDKETKKPDMLSLYPPKRNSN